MDNGEAVMPDFLPDMIRDFPGNGHQKGRAQKAAAEFIMRHGPPPYATMSVAMDFFAAMFRAAGK